MKNVLPLGLLLSALSLGVGQELQPARSLTLQQAIDIALDRNIALKQAQNNVSRDQAGVTAAYGRFLPTVSLSAGWNGRSGESFLPNGNALPSNTTKGASTTLSGNVTLFDGFANTAGVTRATSTASASEYTLNRTRQEIISETQKRFYDVLSAEKQLRIADATLKADNQQLEKVKETARLGSASLVNVYQMQAKVGNDEASLVQAQSAFDLAKSNLISYLSLDVFENYDIHDASIPEELDPAAMGVYRSSMQDLGALSQSAFARRPDYLSAKDALVATDALVTVNRSGYFPTVSANASYGLTGSSTSGLNEFSDLTNNRSVNWSLSFSLPLFSGFQTNSNVEAAQVSQKNAELTLQDTERRIQTQLRNAILQLEAAEKKSKAQVQNLQYQSQNLKTIQEKFNVGSSTTIELTIAQNDYNSALINKTNAVFDYLKAKSQLELALGTLQ